jgi:hypothetical protein
MNKTKNEKPESKNTRQGWKRLCTAITKTKTKKHKSKVEIEVADWTGFVSFFFVFSRSCRGSMNFNFYSWVKMRKECWRKGKLGSRNRRKLKKWKTVKKWVKRDERDTVGERRML